MLQFYSNFKYILFKVYGLLMQLIYPDGRGIV